MKILYWTPRFLPDIGGIEVLAWQKLSLMRERGDELLVFASHANSDPPFRLDYDGIPVYKFPFWAALANRDLRLILQVQKETARLKREFKPDVIHIDFSGYTAYFQLAAEEAPPIPILIALHSSLVGQAGGADTTLGRLFRRATWIVAASQAVLTDAIQAVPEIENKSSVIYYGLNVPSITPLPLPFDPIRIVCVGRLHREKGFDLVIHALVRLAPRYPGLRLTIVGDGPERGALEQQTHSLGMNQVVEFTGAVSNDQVAQWMNTATVVVIPSRYRDAFPLVALEAAFMSRPVVASNAGGLAESIVDGKTGLLVEMENVEVLENAIAYLLDHPETAKEMGAASRMRALDVYSEDKFTEAYDALYRRLIQQSRIVKGNSWISQSNQCVTSSA